jgi:hypothetical protein
MISPAQEEQISQMNISAAISMNSRFIMSLLPPYMISLSNLL